LCFAEGEREPSARTAALRRARSLFRSKIRGIILPNCPSKRGAKPRARRNFPQIRYGGVYWTKSELFLMKIRTANFERSAPPPLASLAVQQKSFLHIFYFAPARFFLLKGKENFFADLCSERAGRRGFASARARQNSPTPLFRLALASATALFSADFWFFFLPTPPCAKKIKELPKFLLLKIKNFGIITL